MGKGLLTCERADCQRGLLRDLAPISQCEPQAMVMFKSIKKTQVHDVRNLTKSSVYSLPERQARARFNSYDGRVPESPREVGSWCDNL